MWASAETADEQRTTYNTIHLAYFTAYRIHLACNVQHVAQELFFLAAAENRDEQRKAALLEQCVRCGSPCTLSELRDCPIKLLGLDHAAVPQSARSCVRLPQCVEPSHEAVGFFRHRPAAQLQCLVHALGLWYTLVPLRRVGTRECPGGQRAP